MTLHLGERPLSHECLRGTVTSHSSQSERSFSVPNSVRYDVFMAHPDHDPSACCCPSSPIRRQDNSSPVRLYYAILPCGPRAYDSFRRSRMVIRSQLPTRGPDGAVIPIRFATCASNSQNSQTGNSYAFLREYVNSPVTYVSRSGSSATPISLVVQPQLCHVGSNVAKPTWVHSRRLLVHDVPFAFTRSLSQFKSQFACLSFSLSLHLNRSALRSTVVQTLIHVSPFVEKCKCPIFP